MNSEKIKTKEKKWLLRAEDCKVCDEKISAIADELKINPIIAKLLYNRGYTDSVSAKAFLYMETEVLSDSFDIKDMDKAVVRIKQAIDRKEKITVYGDYDVDGVTAVCTLYLFLKSKGANISYYIPNRAGEGYGVSEQAISALAEGGTKLIITVDTGITANDEVEFAKSIGVDFVITDHHECRQELPQACAVVNPHRSDCPSKFKELAGVGVVFKTICAYEQMCSGRGASEVAFEILSSYADLVAIGTIADVMPINGENRLIVSYGLSIMEKSPRLGLSALIETASGKNESQRASAKKRKTKITSGYIGYTLAPRINAAGRIRTASIAVELFLSGDYDKALAIAEELCEANKERQNEENKIIKEAYKKIEDNGYDKMPVIVLDADDWHHGVIGIVSSRITEKYGRPSILVSFEGNAEGEISESDIGKGSGRSIKGMNLVDALCYCENELVKFGGHELAAGLSVTRGKLKEFREKINEYAVKALCEDAMTPTVEADAKISIADVTLDLAEQLRILEPYGVGNPVPGFIVQSVSVAEISAISDGKHTRIGFSNGRGVVTAMFFSVSPASLGIYVGDKVDVLFNIDVNEWGGRRSVQLIIRDIKKSMSQRSVEKQEKERFSEVWGGAKFSAEEEILPTRADFAYVYRLITGALRTGSDVMTLKDISYKLSSIKDGPKIGYIKLKIIVKVMQELNIVGIEEIEEEKYRFRMYYKSGKTELDKSNLLRRLRLQQNG